LSAPLCVLAEILGKKKAQLALAALRDAGYVCVPQTPTAEMLKAAYWAILAEEGAETWEEMVTSALASQEKEN
jgi:hypothetical protein